MFYFDPMYFVFIVPGFILSLWATIYVKSTFSKYSRVASSHHYTGAQAAEMMLHQAGVTEVAIQRTSGMLSDHYNPMTRTLNLSDDVYNSCSLAAIGAACHEAGHALQHAEGYAMLGLRSALVPATSIGSNLSYICILLGAFMHKPQLVLWGALLFSVVVLFALITLPVEWNASARAKVEMVRAGIVTPMESDDAARVLRAAFMTYVASAVTAVLTLLYYLWRAGVFGGRRSD